MMHAASGKALTAPKFALTASQLTQLQCPDRQRARGGLSSDVTHAV